MPISLAFLNRLRSEPSTAPVRAGPAEIAEMLPGFYLSARQRVYAGASGFGEI
jgi:hypothetical protein